MIQQIPTVLVKIKWLTKEEGGYDYLPQVARYSRPAKFNDDEDRWPEEAWSVILFFDKKIEVECVARMTFLSEKAPVNLLYKGSKFTIYEGGKIVAFGEVAAI